MLLIKAVDVDVLARAKTPDVHAAAVHVRQTFFEEVDISRTRTMASHNWRVSTWRAGGRRVDVRNCHVAVLYFFC